MDWRWKFIKRPLKKIGQTKAAMYIVSGIVYLYAKLVGLTTSWQTKGVDKFYHLIKENNGVILVIWHGRALMLPYFYDRSSELQALVSPHRDGRIIAGLLQRFGIGTIGGSSNENASGGALGLMQLMPATYNEVVKKHNLPSNLNVETTNITAGSLYYEGLKKVLGNKDLYAITAYNGGIGSVTNWFSKLVYSDTDEFVEQIPYPETKNYVKKVLRTYWVYGNVY